MRNSYFSILTNFVFHIIVQNQRRRKIEKYTCYSSQTYAFKIMEKKSVDDTSMNSYKNIA